MAKAIYCIRAVVTSAVKAEIKASSTQYFMFKLNFWAFNNGDSETEFCVQSVQLKLMTILNISRQTLNKHIVTYRRGRT